MKKLAVPKDRLTLRLDPGMRQQLEALALADHRPLSSLVIKALAELLQKQSAQQQPRN